MLDKKSLLAIVVVILVMVVVKSAGAAVIEVACYRMGEDDSSAKSDKSGKNVIVDKIGGNNVKLLAGVMSYRADVPDKMRPGSTLSMYLSGKKDNGYSGKVVLGDRKTNWGFEGWFKLDSDDPGGQNSVLLFMNGHAWRGGISLGINTDDNYILLLGGLASINSKVSATANEWTHVAGVVEGNITTLYVNGKARGTYNGTPYSPDDVVAGKVARVCIGTDPENDDFAASVCGLVDSCRIFTFNPGEFEPLDLNYYSLQDKQRIKDRLAKEKAWQEKFLKQLVQKPGIKSAEKHIVRAVEDDWLIHKITQPAEALLYQGQNRQQTSLVLTNGLISRSFRLAPNGATVGYDNLMTGDAILRGVKPEAIVELDGVKYEIGGLQGQIEYAYLLPEWLDSMKSDPQAFQLVDLRVNKTKARFPWKRKRYCADLPWPPPGVELTMDFRPPDTIREKYPDLVVSVHYEIYQGIPVLAKWLTIHNGTDKPITLNTFISEILAVVEYETPEELTPPDPWLPPNIHVESDYAFYSSTQITTHWVPDPQYSSQLSFNNQTPNLLECRLPFGPDVEIKPGNSFESFRTFELIYDSTERERKGLALRHMYRAIAPWVTENPIFWHAASSDPEYVRKAIDQSVEVGFEMLILTFGSGLNMENKDPAYTSQIKELVDYAHRKGIELGGYSLLSSRSIGSATDVVMPDRSGLDEALYSDSSPESFIKLWLGDSKAEPIRAIFGHSPCLCSRWSDDYFGKLADFISKTGFDILEHDGSYPGNVCASTNHIGHRGLKDSQWGQWRKITDFYKWCRAEGIYLNIPDWYFLSGGSKTCMPYKEGNNSLPRERQIIINRQNIFDGTWNKTPSMGWMFLPLMNYSGGGAAATIEPLHENLDTYEWQLAQNFGSGVQACYRGPRLYDTEETKAVVKKWVDFYKNHRAILDSDIIHVRRPDGRDIDCILHANPQLKQKGLAMVYNPTSRRIKKELKLPLYYTGLTETAMIRREESKAVKYTLDRQYNVKIPIDMRANSHTWFVIE